VASRPSVALSLLFFALAGAAPARADLAKATAHFEKGTRFYQVTEYAKALEEFKAGYVEEADSSFLYNIAQCYRQLEQPKEALVAYRRFLALSPETPLRPEVEDRIRELEESLRSKPAPAGTPAGAVAQSLDARLQDAAPPAARSRWPVWMGGALTLAFAGSATALGLATNSRFGELRESCGRRPSGCSQEAVTEIQNRSRLVTALWALAGVSAVATGVGVYVTSREAGVSVALKF
jgi:tetratricopeptide (TPR) repeat protein